MVGYEEYTLIDVQCYWPELERKCLTLMNTATAPDNITSSNQSHAPADDALKALASAYGLELGFTDAFGKEQETSALALRKVLNALGVSPCDTPAMCQQRLKEFEQAQWKQVLPKLVVAREGDASVVRVQLGFMPRQPLSWSITQEDGEVLNGELSLTPLNKIAEYTHEKRSIFAKPQLFIAWEWALPDTLPMGYHRLVLTYKDDTLHEGTLAKAPRTAYIPEALNHGQAWGAASQLYSLRSETNYGMGDTQDLSTLINMFGDLGAGAIGLNPMHELFPHNSTEFSPYSPNSRYYLNTLYIHPQNCVDFTNSSEAQRLYDESSEAIEANRAKEFVDYAITAKLKHPIFEAMYRQFNRGEFNANTERAKAFHEYCKEQGNTLVKLAQYEALAEDFYHRDEAMWGWPVWPEAFHNPESVEVKSACVRLQDRIRYFMYLQFVMDEQLTALKQQCQQRNMPIGLYMDLAVGTNQGGADIWMNQALYSSSASVGCPPDLFNQLGQNWGLPPAKPLVMQAQGYEAFIALLRANMRHAGALRIDHALAIFRTFWIPPGETGQTGAYVRYPANDLLGLIALESQRQQCLVIGEDLGTVPEWVRETLLGWNIFSYRIFYFERGEGARYLPPAEYPENALVTISTHDLPTLQSFWQGHDITLRKGLDLFPTEASYLSEIEARPTERQHLLDALIHSNLVPEGFSHNQADYPNELPEVLCNAVDTYLATTPSKFRMVQLEDILQLTTQVNMPGTVNEHPNWRRKLPVNLNDLSAKLKS
jgi:(1->4)-alpha-D-glucan 1-alpha-D-glucosylmutase